MVIEFVIIHQHPIPLNKLNNHDVFQFVCVNMYALLNEHVCALLYACVRMCKYVCKVLSLLFEQFICVRFALQECFNEITKT